MRHVTPRRPDMNRTLRQFKLDPSDDDPDHNK